MPAIIAVIMMIIIGSDGGGVLLLAREGRNLPLRLSLCLWSRDSIDSKHLLSKHGRRGGVVISHGGFIIRLRATFSTLVLKQSRLRQKSGVSKGEVVIESTESKI